MNFGNITKSLEWFIEDFTLSGKENRIRKELESKYAISTQFTDEHSSYKAFLKIYKNTVQKPKQIKDMTHFLKLNKMSRKNEINMLQ